MTEGMEAVRRICEGWNTMTEQDWRDVCTPDVAYQNMPWDRTVVTGPDAIFETLKSFGATFDVRMEVRHLDGSDSVVFSERVEHFTPRGPGEGAGPREPFSLPVAGVFELTDGKVCAWRDYFDRRAMKS